MTIENYFNCNCCLFAQDLLVEHLKDVQIGIPEEDKENYINCNFNLHEPLTEKMPDYNLKHRNSVGCRGWICGMCGTPGIAWNGHNKCWNK